MSYLKDFHCYFFFLLSLVLRLGLVGIVFLLALVLWVCLHNIICMLALAMSTSM